MLSGMYIDTLSNADAVRCQTRQLIFTDKQQPLVMGSSSVLWPAACKCSSRYHQQLASP